MTDNESKIMDELLTKIGYAMVHILKDMEYREDDRGRRDIYSDLAEEIAELSGYGGDGAH